MNKFKMLAFNVFLSAANVVVGSLAIWSGRYESTGVIRVMIGVNLLILAGAILIKKSGKGAAQER